MDLPHDYSEMYNFLELSTNIIAIAPRCLFPKLLRTHRLHTINREKIYIQCYTCNNLFMHKGQDQVNIVEVYLCNKTTQGTWLVLCHYKWADVCMFCCFTSQVNSYGHGGTVSSPNHTFYLGKLEQAVNQYFVHILSIVTDNNPS